MSKVKRINNESTSKEIASIAARILASKKYSAEVKRVAASALTQAADSETVEENPFRHFDVALFTGKSVQELAEKVEHREAGYIFVTNIICVELSKLGEGIEDEYLKIFAKRK